MDIDRLAALIRLLSTTPSRRDIGRALVGLAAGPLLVPAGAAAKKKKKGKKKKKCRRGLKRCGRKCVNVQTDTANCGACGKKCDSGETCAQGTCVNSACDFQVSTVRQLQDAIIEGYEQQRDDQGPSRVICLAAGNYQLTNPNPAELALGQLTTNDLKYYDIVLRGTTLVGAGADTTILTGSGNGTATVISGQGRLEGLTITGGQRDPGGPDLGGGIESLGDLTVVECVITGNSAPDGGGIYNQDFANLTLIRTTITGNTANRTPTPPDNIGGLAGGLLNALLGEFTLEDTDISGNTQAEGTDCYDYSCLCSC